MFAESENPVVLTIHGPADANGLGQVEILLHSTVTDEITDPAFHLKLTLPGGGLVVADTLGAVAFELEGEVFQLDMSFPALAVAVSPGPTQADAEKGGFIYEFRNKSYPATDTLGLKPARADFLAFGFIEYAFSLAFTARDPGNTTGVSVVDAHIVSNEHPDWNQHDGRVEYGVTISGDFAPFARPTRPLAPWVWLVGGPHTTFEIGHHYDLTLTSLIAAGCLGFSRATIAAQIGSGGRSNRFRLDPIPPF